jgi:glycosyltransferase involved in cell wall biosynthesis
MNTTIALSANTSWYLYNFRASTILAFQALGYRVICIAPKDDYSQRLIDDLKCTWVEVYIDNQGSNPIRDIGFMLQLIKIYRQFKLLAVFNFTVKNSVYGTWAARIVKIHAINNISGLGTAFINTGITSLIVRWLYRLSQPLAYRVFCQNEDDFDLLLKKKLIPAEKLFLLPGSGVDTTRFSPNLLRNDAGKFVFLYVGRILGDKGLFELIDAAKTLFGVRQDFTIELCGFLGAKNYSAISAADLADWNQLPFVNYIGTTDTVETVYATANCVVLPSYREGMPRSLLEAGAMGLPSITTDVPGCHNIITDGFNGLLCTVKSAESLFIQMKKILDMSENEITQLATNARLKVVNEFDDSIVVNKAVAVINSLQFHNKLGGEHRKL